MLLQGLTQWQRGRTATRPDEVLAPYRAATGLAPEDLPAFFRLPFWTLRYRGERWAAIAEALLELRAALVTGNEPATDTACDRIGTLRHNSARLVPTTEVERAAWRGSSWQQAKWPALCDETRATFGNRDFAREIHTPANA